MTFSNECSSLNFGGKQKHQMRVTHSAWASTIPGTPRSGPRLPILLAGVAVSIRVESDASRAKWRRATNVCSVGHRKVEKELSMRCRKAVLLAKRLHETGATLTVEAEKGNLWSDGTGRRMTTPGDHGLTDMSAIPEDINAIASGIVQDLPSRLKLENRIFATRVIARAIMAERERCRRAVRGQAPAWVQEKQGDYWDGYREAIDDAVADIDPNYAREGTP